MGGEVRRTSHDARFVSVCFGRGEVSDPAEPNGNVSRRREASAVYTLVYTNASSFELSEHVRYETRTNETLAEYRTCMCFDDLLKGRGRVRNQTKEPNIRLLETCLLCVRSISIEVELGVESPKFLISSSAQKEKRPSAFTIQTLTATLLQSSKQYAHSQARG